VLTDMVEARRRKERKKECENSVVKFTRFPFHTDAPLLQFKNTTIFLESLFYPLALVVVVWLCRMSVASASVNRCVGGSLLCVYSFFGVAWKLLQVASYGVYPYLFHPFLSLSIPFYPFLSLSILFYPALSLSSLFIPFHPPSTTYIGFHIYETCWLQGRCSILVNMYFSPFCMYFFSRIVEGQTLQHPFSVSFRFFFFFFFSCFVENLKWCWCLTTSNCSYN
jgi:hypothetical protein